MLETLKEIFLSPLATIIMYLIGLASFLLTFIFYYKGKRIKLPVYIGIIQYVVNSFAERGIILRFKMISRFR